MRDDLFMITCAARTGSTLLATNLSSHPDILSHGEVYPPANVAALRGRYAPLIRDEQARAALTAYRDANQTAFLYKYVYDAQGHLRVGHKLKHDEMMLPKFSETREAVRRDTDIRIIHLRRENLLQRFVSHWIVRHVTGVTEIHSEDKRPDFSAIRIPPAAAQEDFDQTVARYNFFQNMFAGHEIYEVTYEQLIGPDRDAVLDEIQDFLGVPQRKLSSTLKKVTTKSMRAIIANYDEMKAHFASTPYAAFFTE